LAVAAEGLRGSPILGGVVSCHAVTHGGPARGLHVRVLLATLPAR